MRILLAVVLGLVALAALFFVVAGVVITISGVRTRRGVKGDIALTGFFVVCFVLAAGGSAFVAFPNATGQAEQRQETPRAGQSQAGSEAGQRTVERTEDDTTAQPGPAATPNPSLVLDCKDFTSQEAAQKALDQGVEDQNALDPDTDGAACEALADPDPKPKPEPEKKPKKKPEPKDKFAPEKKSEPEKEAQSKEEAESKKGSESEQKPASGKKAKPDEKR